VTWAIYASLTALLCLPATRVKRPRRSAARAGRGPGEAGREKSRWRRYPQRVTRWRMLVRRRCVPLCIGWGVHEFPLCVGAVDEFRYGSVGREEEEKGEEFLNHCKSDLGVLES
jgi:hypothetical protein